MFEFEQTLAELAVDAWNAVANVNLVYSNVGQAADITFASANFNDSGLYGFAYFPGTTGAQNAAGDVWINYGNSFQQTAVYGDTGWQTYLHELGHALGLNHPDDDPNNNAGDPRNNNQWTVMSYVAHPGQAGIPDPTAAWPLTPMILDIEAIQSMYGANLETNTGNTNYVSGSGAQFALANGGTIGGRLAIFTIWDAGGYDTINASNQTSRVTINLNPGTFSTIGSVANNIGIASAVTVGGSVVNYIESAIGGTVGDLLIGNATANLLDGRGGADEMRGGAGGDTYVVGSIGDIVDESVGGSSGVDTVIAHVNFNLSNTTYVKGAVENLALAGTAAINGAGNALNNVLTGNSAANTLNGYGGTDNMRGMGGSDVYIVDNAGDVIDESLAGSSGVDRVESSISFSLSNTTYVRGSVENLTLIGSAAINGSGNGLNNVLTGNGAANTLNGYGGTDNMRGMGGNDVYIVSQVGDVVDESLAGSSGVDRIESSISFSLSNTTYVKGAVENLTLTGSAAINGAGNGLNNVITGNGAANTLNGYGGNDTLIGGAGRDIFLFNSTLNASTNVDAIAGFSVADDTIQLENAIFTALGAGTGILSENAFHIGTGAADGLDRIIYNPTTGALTYDSNGNAAGGAVRFGTLGTGLALTEADFQIV